MWTVNCQLNYFKIFIILLTFNPFLLLIRGSKNSPRDFETLDKLLTNYDQRVRPNYGGEPVEVGVTAYVLFIPDIDTSKMTMTLDLYFRQTWKDPRLAFNGNKSITLIGSHASKLWTPDTFFVNAQRSYSHETTLPNLFAKISPNGQVLKSSKYTLQLSCPMGSEYFPFDEAECHVNIESFSHTMTDIFYNWDEGNASFKISADYYNNKFIYRGYRLQSFQLNLVSGSYSTLRISVLLSRISTYYVTIFFVPFTVLGSAAMSSLLVADSNVAVLFNAMMLGVAILFLSISSELLDLHKTFPETALLLFTNINYSFILIALLVNILGLYLSKRNKSSKTILQKVGTLQRDYLAHLTMRKKDDPDDLQNSGEIDPTVKRLPPSKTLAFLKKTEEIIYKILPAIKILLVSSFTTAHLIYWFEYPAHTHNDNETLESNGWQLIGV